MSFVFLLMRYFIWHQRYNLPGSLCEAPYAILYHHGLELPENGLNDSSNDQFCASPPMHTMPDKLNGNGIEVTKRQTAYTRCACGNGYKLEYNHEILDN